MQALAIALSAFSARAIRGRRLVLGAYSGLLVLALLALSKLIANAALEDGAHLDPLALADMLAMMLLGAALFVVAPAMVASQVAEERRSGTLDLLRTAPISPTALAAGFLVGAPGSLYLLCAGPIALHVFAGLVGTIPGSALLLSLVLVALGAVAAMLIATMLAVSVGREGGGAAPLVVAGLSALTMLTTVSMSGQPEMLPWAFVHPAGALAVLYHGFDGPFRLAFSSTWRMEQIAASRDAIMLLFEPVLAIGVYGAACLLLLSAARRVLAGDVSSRLTKPTALAMFGLVVLALTVPTRVVVLGSELRLSHLGALAFALMVPYLLCVGGATSSAMGAGARRMSAEGAPLLVSLLMICTLPAAMFLLYGVRVVEVADSGRGAAVAVGFALLALTLPIYARWAATRIGASAGRLAFWALIAVHFCLQLPAIVFVAYEPSSHDISNLLAQIDLVFGVVLPLVVLRRQQLADRRAAATLV